MMDVYDEEFLIEIYGSVSDKYLEILTDSLIILPIIESTQSVNLVTYMKNIKNEGMYIIDDMLILDMDSVLFVNYEEPENNLKVKGFESVYMFLERLVKEFLNKEQDSNDIIKLLDFIIDFLGKNKHEYFSYISVYWLGFYFYKSSGKLKNREKIEYYKEALSEIFPRGRF
ncbi:hypothetical protein ID856_12030 [Xenorhabdus sp. 18]|uniref:hypothetical protein n=1 Tax=Xenorhabdus doucetiae TaxID=351671 RepID=UPI0019A06167|nr:hypothetical protein [Xenorhabdus sp. 18]MBD2797260.1 hypothetical protein [Xenorhabdus sp. 18]